MLHIARDHAGPPLDPYGARLLSTQARRRRLPSSSPQSTALRTLRTVVDAGYTLPEQVVLLQLAVEDTPDAPCSRDRSGHHQLRRRGLGIRAVGDDLDIANGSTLSAS